MGVIIAFPEDDFRPPTPINWRDWAAGQIATVRDRRAREARNEELGEFEPTPTLNGQETALAMPCSDSQCSQWATATDRAAETTMGEITPPLVSTEDRGKGDSTNAAMHRLIGGER